MKNFIQKFHSAQDDETKVQYNKTHPNHLSQTILNRLFGRVLKKEGALGALNNAECYPLPLREREELLSEQSELSNSGEGCKDLPSPDATRHPLPREGKKVSCAEHTVKDLLSNRLTVFTTLKNKLDCFAYARNDELHYTLQQGARKNASCAEHTEKHLFTYLPIHLFTFKKAAFTLAEVLITLAIIGIVAALTLPTLISNHQKQTYVNQLKKAVNTIENAANMAVAKEGASSFEDTSLSALFDEYFLSASTISDIGKVKQVLTEYFKYTTLRIGEVHSNIAPQYKTLSGSDAYYYAGRDGNMMILTDGTIIYFLWYRSFYVDVNGFKGPNTLGRDLFSLKINQKGKIENGYDGYYYQNIVRAGWKMNY